MDFFIYVIIVIIVFVGIETLLKLDIKLIKDLDIIPDDDEVWRMHTCILMCSMLYPVTLFMALIASILYWFIKLSTLFADKLSNKINSKLK